MGKKDNIISIGFDYREALNKACNDITSQLNDAMTGNNISKEFIEEIKKCVSAVSELKQQTNNAFKNISTGKLDTEVFNKFKLTINKQVKEVGDRLDTLEGNVENLNKILGVTGDNVHLSGAIDQFRVLQDFINNNHESVLALLESLNKINNVSIKFNPDDGLDISRIKDYVDEINRLKLQLNQKGTWYYNFSSEQGRKEFDKLSHSFNELIEQKENLNKALEVVPAESLVSKRTEAELSIVELKLADISNRLIALNDRAADKNFDWLDIFEINNLVSVSSEVEGVANKISDAVSNTVLKADESLNKLKGILAENNSLGTARVSNKLDPNTARIGMQIYVSTKNDTLWNQIKEKIGDMQDKLNKNPAILPVKLVLSPQTTKTVDGKNPLESTTSYLKKQVKKVENAEGEQGTSLANQVTVDLDNIFNKTYKQALKSAEDSTKEAIKKIEEIFNSKVFNIHLDVPDDEIEKISNSVFNSEGGTHVDISGQVKKTKEQVEQLSTGLKEVQDIISNTNQQGIRFQGFENLESILNGVIHKLESIEDLFSRGFGLHSVTEVENQWEKVNKVIENTLKVDGTIRKNAKVEKVIDEYQKYLNIGGTNALNQSTKIKKIDNVENVEKFMNTVMSGIKEISRQANEYPIELTVDTENAIKEINTVINQLNQSLKESDNILKAQLEIDKENLKNISAQISDGITIPLSVDASILEQSIKNALSENLINEWKSKFISSVEQIAEKIDASFQRIKSQSDIYNVIKGWSDADNILRTARTGSFNSHNKNTYNEINAHGELERFAYFNSRNGSVSNAFTYDQFGSVSNAIMSGIRDQIRKELNIKSVSDVYDTSLHSHPVRSEYKLDTNQIIRDNTKSFKNSLQEYINKYLSSLNINTNNSDVSKKVSDYINSTIDSMLKNKKISSVELFNTLQTNFNHLFDGVKINGNQIATIIQNSLLSSVGNNISKYQSLDTKAIGSDLTFSTSDLNLYKSELSSGIKKLMVESNGMINELDLSSLPKSIINSIISEYEKGLQQYKKEHFSEYYNVDKNGIKNVDFTKKSELTNTFLSSIIESSINKYNSSHKNSNYSSNSSDYLKQYSIESLKPSTKDIQEEYLEVNNLMGLLEKLSTNLTELNNKEIKLDINQDSIDNVISKLDILVEKISELKPLFSSILSGTNINVSTTLFDGINNSVNTMIDLFRKVNGIASDSELGTQWANIQSKFNRVSDSNGKINLTKQKQDIADIVTEYDKYLKMGGQNTFSALTENFDTISKLERKYKELNRVSQINNSSDINSETQSFSKVNDAVDKLTTAIGTTKVDAIKTEANEMQIAAKEEQIALEWVFEILDQIIIKLEKIKGIKFPEFKINGFDNMDYIIKSMDGDASPLSTVLDSLSESLSNINAYTNVSSIFKSIDVPNKNINNLQELNNILKELPNSIKSLSEYLSSTNQTTDLSIISEAFKQFEGLGSINIKIPKDLFERLKELNTDSDFINIKSKLSDIGTEAQKSSVVFNSAIINESQTLTELIEQLDLIINKLNIIKDIKLPKIEIANQNSNNQNNIKFDSPMDSKSDSANKPVDSKNTQTHREVEASNEKIIQSNHEVAQSYKEISLASENNREIINREVQQAIRGISTNPVENVAIELSNSFEEASNTIILDMQRVQGEIQKVQFITQSDYNGTAILLDNEEIEVNIDGIQKLTGAVVTYKNAIGETIQTTYGLNSKFLPLFDEYGDPIMEDVGKRQKPRQKKELVEFWGQQNEKLIRSAVSGEKTKEEAIEDTNIKLSKQVELLNNIQATYDHSIASGLTKFVPDNTDDYKILSDKRQSIIEMIDKLRNTDASKTELAEINTAISEYKRLAKIKIQANNITKKEMGGQELDVAISGLIVKYSKLIEKASAYGDETQDIVNNLKEELRILNDIDENGKHTITADAFYESQAAYKVDNDEFALREIEIIKQRKEALAKQNEDFISQDSDEWKHATSLLEQYANELGEISKIQRMISIDSKTGTKSLAYLFRDINGNEILTDANGRKLKQHNVVADTSNYYQAYNELNNKLTALSSKNNQSSEYANSIELLRNNIQAINDSLPLKDITSKEEQNRIENLINDTKELAQNIQNMDFKGSSSESRAKLLDKIAKWEEKNTKAMKMPEYADEIERIKNALNTLGNDANVKILERDFNNVDIAIRQAEKSGRSFGDLIGIKFKHMAASTIVQFFSFYDIIRYTREAINTIVELDTAMVDLRKTTTMGASDLATFYSTANDQAKRLGVSTQEIIQQAADWSRLGFSDYKSSTTMAELSSQFASISPDMDVSQATDGMVSIIKAFDISVDDVERRVMDNINKIGKVIAETYSNVWVSIFRCLLVDNYIG